MALAKCYKLGFAILNMYERPFSVDTFGQDHPNFRNRNIYLNQVSWISVPLFQWPIVDHLKRKITEVCKINT